MEPSGLEPLTSWVRSMDGSTFAFRDRLQGRAVWVRPWRAFMSSNSALRGGPRVPRPSPPTRRASTAAPRRPGAGRPRLPMRGRRRGRGPRGRRPPPSRGLPRAVPAAACRRASSSPAARLRAHAGARRPRKGVGGDRAWAYGVDADPRLGPRSSAAVRTRPSTACFEAVYEAWPASAGPGVHRGRHHDCASVQPKGHGRRASGSSRRLARSLQALGRVPRDRGSVVSLQGGDNAGIGDDDTKSA